MVVFAECISLENDHREVKVELKAPRLVVQFSPTRAQVLSSEL